MRLVHVKEPEHEEEAASKKAEKILKIKPDVILFEYPVKEDFSLSYFNKFNPEKKPKDKIKELKKGYEISSKKYPWLKTEYKIFEAIEKLWDDGKQVYLFEIDAPVELTSVENTKGLLNIVWNFLRETYMIENIKKIESRFDKDKVALVFCHDFHWKNIQFLLKNPGKEEIWNHYFMQKSPKEIEVELEQKNKILHKFWKLRFSG